MASYYDQINSLSPRVWYRFNETAGTPTNSGGLSTTATFNNLLLNEQTDVDGRAIYFNGSDSRIQVNTWPAFSLFDDKLFTIETWFKLATQDTTNRQLFRFSGETPISNTLGVQSMGSSDANSGKLRLNVVGLGEQVADRDTYTTNTYFDNTWHHLVVTVNTTSLKWYIDGQLITTKTLATGTLNWDSYNSSNLQRLIGVGRSNTSATFTSYYKGWLDEFAIYNTELSGAQVLANFNAGASVNFADTPGTATALAVQPTLTTTAELTAAPMTASADGAGHAASTVNLPTMLETYMAGRTLETWYKFNTSQQLTNYGSLPTKVSIFETDASTNTTAGIQGSGALLTTGGANGGVYNLSDNVGPLIADKDFSLGFWVKKLTKEQSRIVFFNDTQTSGDYIDIFWNTDGGITTTAYFNNSANTIASSTDITDGNWHYVAVRQSNNTLQMWIDNTSIGTQTITHAYSALDTMYFGNDNGNTTTTEKMYISQFYVATAANITSTEIANIYTAGTSAEIQAAAIMPEAKVKFNSAFNDYIVTKSPIIDVRLDEGSGAPLDYGSAGLSLVSQQSPQGYTQNETGLNTRAFKFTDRLQAIRGNYALASGTVSNSNECTIGILFKSANATNVQAFVGFGGRGGAAGTGFSLQQLASSGYLRIIAGNSNGTTNTFTGATNVADNKWHLAIIVKEASTIKLYIDGKLDINSSCTNTLTDSGEFSIAAIAGIDAATASRDTLIDEIFVTAGVFTAQEAFEAFRSLRLEMDTTASASLPMPTNIAGTGNIQSAEAKTASALLPMSTNSTDQVLDAAPGTASALFVLPNFGGNVVIDANYGHEAFTASAVFHEPQLQIGDIHGADHMDASALMVHPAAIAGGSISVSTAVGSALFVMPGIVTVKGARVFADPMRAQSLFPLPPAYIQLTDDPWFVRLYEAHADRKTEPKQAVVAAGSESTEIIKGGFLTFFDDHLADRSPTSSPNTITSELPAYFFNPISSTGAVDTTKGTTAAIAPRQSNNPAPLLAIAGQDNQERKAVRVNNIEFVLPGTSKNFSERYYNVEFSIKTTKADQVLSYGQWESFQNYGSRIGVIGLSDGKIYLATDDSSPLGTSLADLRRNIPSTAPHPKNLTATNAFGYFQGRNNIADGNWHHVVIQYGWTDGRTQIWVDGNLDRQIGVLNELGGSGYATFSGSNGTNEIRPYILGFNSNDPLLYSDFTISAWNFFPGRFLEQRDINLNYTAYGKWEPIKAEPMTASVATPQNHRAAGNRARALMLYFWPVERELGTSKSLTSTDNGQFGAFDEPTFENFLTNVDRIEYQGWDVFPVDVIGTRVSPMIKPEVWGGYGYRDQITGAPRYLDLVNDIDLSLFDAIFFRNFPEQTEELDEYVRQEFSDTYFNVKEADLYENFLASLRAAVDQGLSLYVTNSKLALDLGIVDRVEVISDISEDEFAPTSSYVTSILPTGSVDESGTYIDTHRNNRFRVVNTLDGLTNEESYIWRDWAYFENDDQLDYGGPNRPYASVLHRPNGLQIGDEFVNSSATLQGTEYEAVPFANVKAGKIITAFSNTIKTGSSTTDNPYKNYATCIAVEPGTILKGKATGGKIFVNFTERLQGSVSQISGNVAQGRRPIYSSRDVTGVDLNQDKWINLAYDQGQITLTKKNELLAASGNLDRQLEAAIAGGNSSEIARINQLKYWDSNGINILSSKKAIDDITGSGDISDSPGRQSLINRTKKSGDPGTAKVTTFGQWFTFEYSWLFPRLQVATVSMLTRGFRWLSDRIVDEGLVNRVQSMNVATSELVMPVVTADKDRTIYAASMLANATIIHAPGYALADVSNTTLPLTATAKFGDFVKNIVAEPFTATALIRQPRISGIEEDEIVVYIHHVDPILYLREDIIK